jgi:lipase (class 3)
MSNLIPIPASTAAQLAALTYCPNPSSSVPANLPGWTVVWNGQETSDGNYAYIALDPTSQYYVLAIRGSLPVLDAFKSWDDFANWFLEDFDIITRADWPYSNTSGALISNGMNTAFDNLINMADTMGSGLNVTNYLVQHAANANLSITITGHSLGGAMANVYGSYFNWYLNDIGYGNSNSDNYIFTFAAPGAGNGIFATDLDSKFAGNQSWHYDIDNDIIPKLPVFLAMTLLAALYIPDPSAYQISVTYDGYTVSLAEAIIGIAVAVAPYGYQQQANNYNILSYAVSGQYAANTVEDWFSEAGYQHTVGHYVAAVGGNQITC